MKTGYILLLHTMNTPELQGQTLPLSKGLGKNFHSNGSKKQAGLTILISTKIYLKTKLIKIDQERCFIVIKEKIHQDEVEIVNIYAPKTRDPHLKTKPY